MSATQETRRLQVLKESLQKKQERFDATLANHFESVKAANGQPLNDKRNGGATLQKWDAQSRALRSQQESIEVTKRAIEREEEKISAVAVVSLPDAIRKMLDTGALVQWRKHPNTFFVPGVERARIVWDEEKKALAHRYVREVPSEQYEAFRDAYNGLMAAITKAGGAA